MVPPTAPVAPTTATVSLAGLVPGMVRPANDGLSGTAEYTSGPSRSPPGHRRGRTHASGRRVPRSGRDARAHLARDLDEARAWPATGSGRVPDESDPARLQLGRHDRDRRGRPGRRSSSGTSATPRPAAAIARTVPLSSERNTNSGSRPALAQALLDPARAAARAGARSASRRDQRQRAAGRRRGGERRLPGASRARTDRAGAPPPRRARAGSGNTPNAAPGPRRHEPQPPSSLRISVSRPRSRGQRLSNRPMIAGRARAPDALVDADAHGAGLAARVRQQIGARGLEPIGDRLHVTQEQPPGLGQRHRAPAAPRSNSRTPSDASSAATCWLTADCVKSRASAAPWNELLLRHRPEREQLAQAQVGERVGQQAQRGVGPGGRWTD